MMLSYPFRYLILRMRSQTCQRFCFRGKKCPKMCLKINCSVKTLLHKPSMGVARSGLWAPSISEFPVRKFSDNKDPGGGGNSWEFLVGGCRPVPQIPTQFQTKKCNFPHPFSEQTFKIHTRFQTWPLGRNYVIITQIRAQTKKLFKSISNSHISLSFLLIWNWNDKYVHTLRSSFENHTRFQTKMGKIYTRFQAKTTRHTYMAYIRRYRPSPWEQGPVIYNLKIKIEMQLNGRSQFQSQLLLSSLSIFSLLRSIAECNLSNILRIISSEHARVPFVFMVKQPYIQTLCNTPFSDRFRTYDKILFVPFVVSLQNTSAVHQLLRCHVPL